MICFFKTLDIIIKIWYTLYRYVCYFTTSPTMLCTLFFYRTFEKEESIVSKTCFLGKPEHKCVLSFVISKVCRYGKNTDLKDDVSIAVAEYNGDVERPIYMIIESIPRKEGKFSISVYNDHPENCQKSLISDELTDCDIARGMEKLGMSNFDETIKIVEKIGTITIVIQPKPQTE